jgi:glycerol-3-phosphate dehydrogenase (NAD(P)+)
VRVAVLGGGSWGTALAAHAARSGHDVRFFLRDPAIADAVRARHENPRYLPGVALPETLRPVTSVAEALEEAETVLLVLPSEFFREVLRSAMASLPRGAILVSATKGIEHGSLHRMTEVAAEEAPGHPLAALSGPSFAREVAEGKPAAVVVASMESATAEAIQRAFSTRLFRIYASTDLVGVELGGALKNVVAIAAGMMDGLGYGQNIVAALITRGLAEMTRLAVALGGRPDTLAGLAGLGDLVLTSTGALSRNRRVGQALGKGMALGVALRDLGMVAEGVRNTLAACALAERCRVEMPITFQMRAVLYEGKPPQEAVDELMLRSLKRE